MTPETRAAMEDAERSVQRRIDPGPRAMLFSVAVLAAVVALLLPWVQGSPGWQVLAGTSPAGPLPTLFSWTLTAFGVAVSAAAITTRLWVLAFAGAVGCGISAVNGVWAIWSLQTGAGGPGWGVVLGLVAVLVLAFNWAGMALRRS
ncbi:Rv2732c family membrane protein [Pseudonocardia phyllosphaerae]|uniref:Rv2732c family membrane protein n=1 Tax=Pseudonocardia phyllosphaerae TaxID=3390502 RepID=UPI00397CE57A